MTTKSCPACHSTRMFQLSIWKANEYVPYDYCPDCGATTLAKRKEVAKVPIAEPAPESTLTESTLEPVEKTVPTVFADTSPDEVVLPKLKSAPRTRGDITIYTPDHTVKTATQRPYERRVYTHSFAFCPHCGKPIPLKLSRPFYGSNEEWYRCSNTECLRCWYLTRDSNGISTIEPQTITEFLADISLSFKKSLASDPAPKQGWQSGDLTQTP